MKLKNQKTLANIILTNVKENEALVIYNPALIYCLNINFKLKIYQKLCYNKKIITCLYINLNRN